MSAKRSLLTFLKGKGMLAGTIESYNVLEEPLLSALAERGLIDEQKALEELRLHFKIPLIDLGSEQAKELFAKYPFRGSLDPEFCKKHLVLPLWEKRGKVLTVIANPFNLEGVKGAEMILSRQITLALAPGQAIQKSLHSLFPASSLEVEGGGSTAGSTPTLELSFEEEESSEVDYSSDRVHAAPIVKLTNRIILDAVRLEASDVHLEPTPEGMSVRFRIGGVLQEIVTVPVKMQHHVTARFKILAMMDIAERRKPQDGRFQVKIDGNKIDIRCSSIPTSGGEKIVLRVLGGSILEKDFSSIGMPAALELRVQEALHKKGKLFLVTGPTGSGKTTSLYVGINYLNDGSQNITTIEDPIEYKLKGISQSQVNTLAGMTFAKALRSMLRQDPDVILVGEMRDPETVKIALQASQTGHLVMSTLHTNDAVSAVGRLKDMGADPKLLGESLIGVLAQRLVRKICPYCTCDVDGTDLDVVLPYLSLYGINEKLLKKGKGCDKCFFTGYRGRLGIFSYLHVGEQVTEAIQQEKSNEQIVRIAAGSGFQTLEQAALDLLKLGATTFEEIRPYLDLEKARQNLQKKESSPEPPSDSAASSHSSGIATVQRVKAPSAEPRQEAPAPTQVSVSEPARVPRILIVDDNASARKIVATLLRKEAVSVTEAEDGLHALQQVNREIPDLILCDLQMPRMNGKEFLTSVRNNRITRDVPVIMLTIDDKPENEMELLKLGASSFLSKRVSPDVLLSRIRKALGVEQ